jgi:hypothetical protein
MVDLRLQGRREEQHMAARTSKAVEDMHALTWEWMQKTMDELREIGKLARDASKRASNLAEKVELQRVAKRAEAGHSAVARIFGEPGHGS